MKYILILGLLFLTGCNDGFSFNSGPPTCESQTQNWFTCYRHSINNISCEQFIRLGNSNEALQMGSQIAQVCMQQNTLPGFQQNCRQETLSEIPNFMKTVMSDVIGRCQ